MRTSEEILRDALGHFRAAQIYAAGEPSSQVLVDAICMRLAAGIEALSALEPALRSRLFGDEWSLMWGMRNRIAHGYMLVDAAIVEATVRDDLPMIIERIETHMARATGQESEL